MSRPNSLASPRIVEDGASTKMVSEPVVLQNIAFRRDDIPRSGRVVSLVRWIRTTEWTAISVLFGATRPAPIPPASTSSPRASLDSSAHLSSSRLYLRSLPPPIHPFFLRQILPAGQYSLPSTDLELALVPQRSGGPFDTVVLLGRTLRCPRLRMHRPMASLLSRVCSALSNLR